MTVKQWKKVDDFEYGEFFTFENPGDALEGKLLGFREIETKNGPTKVADLEDEKGRDWTVFVSAGMQSLREKLVGCMVRIEFLGMERNDRTKRYFKKFDVFVDAASDVIVDGDVPF